MFSEGQAREIVEPRRTALEDVRGLVSMTDADRLSATLRFLSNVSRTLASSFDFSQTLAGVAAVTVPHHADVFAIAMVEDGPAGYASMAHAGNVEASFAAHPIGPSLSERRFTAHGPRELPQAADFPLVAREQFFGILRVGRVEGFDSADIALFEELALRAALAIDSARAYAREHLVADTLQRALLPERLPTHENMRYDAAYRPGAEESIVGGDWYDAFELPDGRIAISIGDVAGHGLRAAVVMGEVRQAFRASAINPKSPSLVIERANTIVNMRANPVMVTALFGIIDPTTSTLSYASAGHPPPILTLPSGMAERLPADGIPLGIADEVEATDWTFTLPPGSLLTLYTDGLIEYSRDVVAGEAMLLDALREQMMDVPAPPDAARALQRRIFANASNTDDVATLTVTIAPQERKTFHYEFSAITMAVPLVRRSLSRWLESIELDEDTRFGVLTAVGEAIANAVEHAYGTETPGIACVDATCESGELEIKIEDRGKWRPAQKRDERGRGLPMMRALMDGVEIRSDAKSTCVALRKTVKRKGDEITAA